jgi:hypothetical protein
MDLPFFSSIYYFIRSEKIVDELIQFYTKLYQIIANLFLSCTKSCDNLFRSEGVSKSYIMSFANFAWNRGDDLLKDQQISITHYIADKYDEVISIRACTMEALKGGATLFFLAVTLKSDPWNR